MSLLGTKVFRCETRLSEALEAYETLSRSKLDIPFAGHRERIDERLAIPFLCSGENRCAGLPPSDPASHNLRTPGDVQLACFHPSWVRAGAVRAGVGYFLDEKTELYGSVGFDTSAIPKSTLEPTYPDAFKLMGSLGARREIAERFVLGVSYTYVGYLSVDTGRQNLFGAAGASRVPNEDGTLGSRLMFFNVNAAFAF